MGEKTKKKEVKNQKPVATNMRELATLAIRVASSVIQCVSTCDIEAFQAPANSRRCGAMSKGRLLGTIMLLAEDRTLESVYKEACTLLPEQQEQRCLWQVECNFDGYTHHNDGMGAMVFKVRVIQPKTEHALPDIINALWGNNRDPAASVGTYGVQVVWCNADCECYVASSENNDMQLHMQTHYHFPILHGCPLLFGDCIVFLNRER